MCSNSQDEQPFRWENDLFCVLLFIAGVVLVCSIIVRECCL
jgi:hypothetical protein